MKKLIYLGLFVAFLSTTAYALQTVFPDSDLNNADGYTTQPSGNSLYDMLDGSDATYIISPLLVAPKRANVTLGDLENPISNKSGFFFTLRAKDSASSGQTVDLDATLFQTGKKIVTCNFPSLTTTFGLKICTLTDAEGESITDFTDLILEIKGSGSFEIPRNSLEVSRAVMMISDVIPYPSKINIHSSGDIKLRSGGQINLRK